MRWSEGWGEPGSTSDNPVPKSPVDRRGLRTELNIDAMFFWLLFLHEMFKITDVNKTSINFYDVVNSWLSLASPCHAIT